MIYSLLLKTAHEVFVDKKDWPFNNFLANEKISEFVQCIDHFIFHFVFDCFWHSWLNDVIQLCVECFWILVKTFWMSFIEDDFGDWMPCQASQIKIDFHRGKIICLKAKTYTEIPIISPIAQRWWWGRGEDRLEYITDSLRFCKKFQRYFMEKLPYRETISD